MRGVLLILSLLFLKKHFPSTFYIQSVCAIIYYCGVVKIGVKLCFKYKLSVCTIWNTDNIIQTCDKKIFIPMNNGFIKLESIPSMLWAPPFMFNLRSLCKMIIAIRCVCVYVLATFVNWEGNVVTWCSSIYIYLILFSI